MARSLAVILGLTACGPSEPPDCEVSGVPTCDSELIVQFRDGRSGPFRITLADNQGMSLVIDCPDLDTGLNELNGYTWVCGQGRVTVNTVENFFGDTILVGVGFGEQESVEPTWQRGGDACGNPCRSATIEL